MRIGFNSPQFLIQPPEQTRQIAVAQSITQRKCPRRFVPRTNGGNIGKLDFLPLAGEQAQFFNLVVKLARIGTDAIDQFGQRFLGNFLLTFADGRARRDFRAFRPIAVIHRPAGKSFDRPDFIEGFEKGLALVHLAGADEQPDSRPFEFFKFLGQIVQRSGDRLRRRGAFVAEKIAVAQPDDLAGAKKWEGLQRFAQPGQRGERLAAVGDSGLDDFVVHAAQFITPLMMELFGALFDGKLVVAANEGHRLRSLDGGHFIQLRCRFH